MEHEPAAQLSADQCLIADLRAKLREAEETLDAIRYGEVDAVLVKQSGSSKIYTLVNADRPYRFLIEQMKEGAVTLSEEGVVLYGNRRLGEILDTPIEKIVGSNIKRFLFPDGAAKLQTLLVAKGPEPSRGEFSVQRAGKSPVPIYISITDIVSDAGAPRLIGGVVSDLTQQHEIEARFSQAQKMEAVGQLTGGLAHDFNNLLQAIRGNLDLIRMRPFDLVGVTKWAGSGLWAAERGAKLTSKLLAFSRTQQIDVRAVEVDELVWGMSDLLRRTLGSDIDIRYELDRSGISAFADRTQLELAILNMAINARDAMPAGGQLKITTRLHAVTDDPELPAGEYLSVCVIDTGSGMAEDVRARAFDPFFTTKKTGEGSGLGLAQVYGIARQAGGAARILSSEAIGTTVTLLLRRAPSAGAEQLKGARTDGLAPGRTSAKVLVVDDDDDVRDVLALSLSWLGYEVSQACSGAAGLEMMVLARPDILVTDFLMPNMNGAEMVKSARARGFGMPVIFATGFADTSALDNAIGCKANVISKPFSAEELAQRIEKTLLQQDLVA
jgi:PAS domain S-box-containing protein